MSMSATPSPYVTMNVCSSRMGWSCLTRPPVIVCKPVLMTDTRQSGAVERNTQLQRELDEAKAEIRQLKAERFGKQSEKRSVIDRSNHLDDPREQATPRKKRGQQPGRPAPKRRDYSHLPALEEQIDLSDKAISELLLQTMLPRYRAIVSGAE